MVLRIMNLERYFFELSVRNPAQGLESGSGHKRAEIRIYRTKMPAGRYPRFDINSIMGMFG